MTRREYALLSALTLVPLLPFLDNAVSIDGPVFVEVAQQILEDPGDPFGFDMIWDPTSPHAAEFNRNPPLLSYYLAVWIGIFGESDLVMHAALLVFPWTERYEERHVHYIARQIRDVVTRSRAKVHTVGTAGD